jgi:hypothetical protein
MVAVQSMSSKYMSQSLPTGSVSTADVDPSLIDRLIVIDITQVESLIPKEFGQDAVELPGSRIMLEKLEEQAVPWCIVTSGTRPLVTGWLDVMKLAHPKKMESQIRLATSWGRSY